MPVQSHVVLSRSYAVAIVVLLLPLVTSLARAQQPQTPTPPAPVAQTAPAIVPFVPAATPEQEQLRFVPAKRYGGQVHLLPATLETTQWGWFNNAQPPVLHVNSGDTIVFVPDPKKFSPLAVNRLGEPTNATPAISDGEIFIRTSKSLYCIGQK